MCNAYKKEEGRERERKIEPLQLNLSICQSPDVTKKWGANVAASIAHCPKKMDFLTSVTTLLPIGTRLSH
jgi:hypothetical protein